MCKITEDQKTLATWTKEEFIAHRSYLVEGKSKAIDSADKALLALITLTLGFVFNMADTAEKLDSSRTVIILLMAALGLSLFSQYIAAASFNEQRKTLDHEYSESKRSLSLAGTWTWVLRIVNIMTIGLFLYGTILFTIHFLKE